jgi:ectoine hydroxylase-related dioxygenase (phytanoyl-CoA dioxygenase family)
MSADEPPETRITDLNSLPAETVAEDGGNRFAGFLLNDDSAERMARAARDRVFAEIGRLDLIANVGELEMKGYTALTPEQVGPPEFIDRLREAIIALAEMRSEQAIDRANGLTFQDDNSPYGQVHSLFGLFGDDPIFERALMNEAMLALVTYLLGESCFLHHERAAIKGPGDQYLPMHADPSGPTPYPWISQVCNTTFALTDHSIEDGTTCFVPGSHRLCRQPTRAEAMDLSSFVPLEVPAGSLIVWHGNAWHGALPRKRPGIRVSLVQYFSRPSAASDVPRNFNSVVTPAMLARNPPRFATLLGVDDATLRLESFKAQRTGYSFS